MLDEIIFESKNQCIFINCVIKFEVVLLCFVNLSTLFVLNLKPLNENIGH